jgi:GTP-binding protein
VVVLNKTDLSPVRERIRNIKDAFRQKGVELFSISALTGEGVDEMIREIGRQWERLTGAVHG